MRASQEGHVEITSVLIASRCDVNRKNLEGMNALMLASQRGHALVVLELVKAGASVDEQTTQVPLILTALVTLTYDATGKHRPHAGLQEGPRDGG